MPEFLEKTLTLGFWHAGMADVDLDEYANLGEVGYIQNADIYYGKPFLKPQRQDGNDSTGLNTGLNGKIGKVRGYTGYNGKAYCVDHGNDGGTYRLGIFEQSLVSGSWSSIDDDTTINDSTEPPGGCWVQDGYLYYFATGTKMNQYNISTDTLTASWDNLAVTAWGGSDDDIGGYLQHTDGATYIFKGRYIGPYDGTTKPSLITPIDLPSGYIIADAVSYGNKILVLANPNSSFGGTARLFLYDPYAPLGIYTFEDVFDLKIFNAKTVRVVGNRVLIISAHNDYIINEWVGGDGAEPVKRLAVGYYDADELDLRRESVDVFRTSMFFSTSATSSVSSDFSNGTYAYGFADKGDPWSLQNYWIPGGGDLTGIDHKAMKWIMGSGIAYMFRTSYDTDDAEYDNNRLQEFNGSYTSKCITETTWMRPFRGLKSAPLKMSLYGGGSVKVEQKVDGGSYTTIGTFDSFAAEKYVITNNDSSADNTFSKGNRHKFRFTLGNTSVNCLEKVKIRVRSAEQE